jgi:hypothetical protein
LRTGGSGGAIRGTLYYNSSNQFGFLDTGGTWALRYYNDDRYDVCFNGGIRSYSITDNGGSFNYAYYNSAEYVLGSIAPRGTAGDDVATGYLTLRWTGTINVFLKSDTTSTFTYALTHGSDLRLKENIVPMSRATEQIEALNPVWFDWKNRKDNTRNMGFIAQEVEQIFPELIVEMDNGYKSLAYQNLTALLVKGQQETNDEVAQLKTRVSQLEEIIQNNNLQIP